MKILSLEKCDARHIIIVDGKLSLLLKLKIITV